jgi:hypothetical protein
MIEKHFDGSSDERIIGALTHDPGAYPMALGCASCPQREVCGGLCIKAPIVDCLAFCCSSPDSCTRVPQPARRLRRSGAGDRGL